MWWVVGSGTRGSVIKQGKNVRWVKINKAPPGIRVFVKQVNKTREVRSLPPQFLSNVADDFPLSSGGGNAPAQGRRLEPKVWTAVLSQPLLVELQPFGVTFAVRVFGVPFVMSRPSLAEGGEGSSAQKAYDGSRERRISRDNQKYQVP